MATDVANAIISGSKAAFKDHCQANTCEVQVTMRRERYRYSGSPETYTLLVTPMDSHVLIQYGSLRFRAPRADRTAFQDMLSSLYGMLSDKCKEADKADVQQQQQQQQGCPDFEEFEKWHSDMASYYEHQGEEGDPYYDARFRVVQQGEVQVDLKRVPLTDLEGVFMHHMGAMRFLSC